MASLSRRGFLRTGLTGAAGIALAPGIIKAASLTPQDNIIYRTLGKTGMKVPVVSFGVMRSDNSALCKAAYEKGISKMLKEADRYASEGQIYGMHVYIENAINYAAKAGIDISGELPKFMPAYEKGLEGALQEAEMHESKGFLGMSYQYIHRAGNYAAMLGKNIDEILRSLPWYEIWAMTNVHMKLR